MRVGVVLVAGCRTGGRVVVVAAVVVATTRSIASVAGPAAGVLEM